MRASSVEIEARIVGDAEAVAERLQEALERRGDLAGRGPPEGARGRVRGPPPLPRRRPV